MPAQRWLCSLFPLLYVRGRRVRGAARRGTCAASACVQTDALHLAPSAVRRFLRERSTGLFSGLPYLATSVNCAIWVLYGCVTPGRLAPLATNAVGLAVEVPYCLLFWHLCVGEKRTLFARQCCGALAALLAFALVTTLAVPKRMRTPCVGLVADVLNVAMFAAPLSLMVVVLRRRSVDGLSLPLSCVQLSCSAVWAAYGAALGDTSILVPNSIGVGFTLAQLGLYAFVSCSGGKGGVEEEALDTRLLEQEEEQEVDDGGLSTSTVVDWVA